MAGIDLKGPFEGIRGGYKGSAMVFFRGKDGRQFGRAYGKKSRTLTEEQTKVRIYMTVASRAWKNVSLAQRKAWQAYAEKYFKKNELGEEIIPSGQSTYFSANVIRQVLGLPLVADAPTVEPPLGITTIDQMTAQNPDTLGITIVHSLADLTGLQLIVRVTGPTESIANAPDKTDLRYVLGVGPDSATALLASGGQYTFDPLKYPVEAGQRFGVEVRVLRTADGIMSKPIYGDFVKAA